MLDANHLADGTLFGNDAGEDELPEVLASYFVDKPEFSSFFDTTRPLAIARSRKGMGKSALISKFAYDLMKLSEPPIIIRTTGAQIIGIESPDRHDYLYLQNYWARVICARVNFELGKVLDFTFSDHSMALIQNAELAGFKDRNIVTALISRLGSSKIPLEVKSPSVGNHEELLKRALETNRDREVWLLLDDIDSTYINEPDQQALISTFFSAARMLVRDIRGLKIRATVRTDVWTNFTKNEDLDKCEQYVIDLSWSAKELQNVLSKKIISFLTRNKLHNESTKHLDFNEHSDNVLEIVFRPRMQWGNSAVRPFRPIQILSSGRPRWMSQLCRFAGQQTAKQRKSLIGIQDINYILNKYTRYRLDDIYKEHSHQFSDLKNLIETFSNKKARYKTRELFSLIVTDYTNRVGSSNVPPIDGMNYSTPMDLAHFLFKIGFIAARRPHRDGSQFAEFVRHEERPELLTDTRNPDDGLEWEVYPSYRNALGILSAGRAKKKATSRRGKRS